MKSCIIRVKPKELLNKKLHKKLVAEKTGVREKYFSDIILKKRSLDCRGKTPVYELLFELVSDQNQKLVSKEQRVPRLQNVKLSKEVIVIGAGPCGLFAALRLIELGLRPIIFERGKAIKARRRDVAKISRGKSVDPNSNYCFGLGGAGTFSDGKLYCRSVKPKLKNLVLDLLVHYGSDPDILVNSRPHIGTNKLPQVIDNIHNSIVEAGGEIRFGSKVENLITHNSLLKGVELESGIRILSKAVIIATGHSASDIFDSLRLSKINLERKPFALGVRIEHPQSLIDKMQYGLEERGDFLPAASYSLKTQVSGHGVYSFCMCPGGIICPASTREGELVVNGWSPSKRNSRFANSGIVAEISDNDLKEFGGNEITAAKNLQKKVETSAWLAGGGNFKAPAQRLSDFLDNSSSSATLPEASYNPGLTSSLISEIFPEFITNRLREGLKNICSKYPMYNNHESIIIAPESRTSSVYRIPRDLKNFQNPQITGLFPAGEGAGYAGGIMSAAVDGWNVADGVSRFLSNRIH